ncbi:lipoprotein [Spiroplasma endosymbiont of Phyllotreta cruciferae]|uniref:lipoprotein n=1 Tax=Spiroplasma endosymbiont of Phyllotreta cruciferae TaxID=2886375 RepID=UPI0020A00AD5|nr:lipoprotein [Spiroplasma endosymbiont of Phyllotreta cruciferae]
MKRLLSIIGAISLVGTSTTSLVACNTKEYSSEKLKELKEKNKINTTDENVKNNLEWISPQEKPFNKVDNKWYYVIWKGRNWNITKFKNDEEIIPPKHEYEYKLLQEKEEYKIQLRYYSHNDTKIDLIIFKSINEPTLIWGKNSNNFKSIYRWNLDTKESNLIIDNKGNVKVK